MIAIFETRRQVRLHAAEWADEAIETYGANAERVLRAMQSHCGLAERYAFREVRRVIRRQHNQPSLASSVAAFLKDVAIKGPTVGAARH